MPVLRYNAPVIYNYHSLNYINRQLANITIRLVPAIRVVQQLFAN